MSCVLGLCYILVHIFLTLVISLFSFCSNHTATQPHNFATSRPHYSTSVQYTEFFYGNPKLNVISHRCNHFNSKLFIKTLIFHLPCVWILLREINSVKLETMEATKSRSIKREGKPWQDWKVSSTLLMFLSMDVEQYRRRPRKITMRISTISYCECNKWNSSWIQLSGSLKPQKWFS